MQAQQRKGLLEGSGRGLDGEARTLSERRENSKSPAHSCPFSVHSFSVCHGLSHLWLMNTTLKPGTCDSRTVLLSLDRGILPHSSNVEKSTTSIGASRCTDPHMVSFSSVITCKDVQKHR